MVLDVLPPKFGQAIDVDVEAIFRKEDIMTEDFPLEEDVVRDLSGRFGHIVNRTFSSLTHANLNDVVNVYVLKGDDFGKEFGKNTTMNYGQEIDISRIPAFQCGYRVFLRSGLKRSEAFLYLMHEIGGTLIPHSINQTGEDTTIKPKTKFPFLTEVAQFYFQYAALAKWCVENDLKSKDVSITHDLSSLPFHYHATVEALRLLKSRQSPLQAYPKHYDGQIEPKSNLVKANLMRKDGLEQPYWIGPTHPEYKKGRISSLDPTDL